jgi:DnaA family protein
MLAEAGPELIDGLASRELICLDDLDAVAGNPAWESALFDLCNQVLDADRCLIVSASVQTLGDDERVSALQLRAQHRGLDLPDDTARYLLKRSRRDMASLYALLDKLDLEALRAQRRLTIPFVKGVLET